MGASNVADFARNRLNMAKTGNNRHFGVSAWLLSVCIQFSYHYPCCAMCSLTNRHRLLWNGGLMCDVSIMAKPTLSSLSAVCCAPVPCRAVSHGEAVLYPSSCQSDLIYLKYGRGNRAARSISFNTLRYRTSLTSNQK